MGQNAISTLLDGRREVFFFSSRRRHTRWTGDWSSDVCSSDLGTCSFTALARALGARDDAAKNAGRSEERRVGKEGRGRWTPESIKREWRSREGQSLRARINSAACWATIGPPE